MVIFIKIYNNVIIFKIKLLQVMSITRSSFWRIQPTVWATSMQTSNWNIKSALKNSFSRATD